jgi:hypothetical protein
MCYIFKNTSVIYNLLICILQAFLCTLCSSLSGAFRVLYSYRGLSVTPLSSLYTWIERECMHWDKLVRKTPILSLRCLEIILALNLSG